MDEEAIRKILPVIFTECRLIKPHILDKIVPHWTSVARNLHMTTTCYMNQICYSMLMHNDCTAIKALFVANQHIRRSFEKEKKRPGLTFFAQHANDDYEQTYIQRRLLHPAALAVLTDLPNNTFAGIWEFNGHCKYHSGRHSFIAPIIDTSDLKTVQYSDLDVLVIYKARLFEALHCRRIR